MFYFHLTHLIVRMCCRHRGFLHCRHHRAVLQSGHRDRWRCSQLFWIQCLGGLSSSIQPMSLINSGPLSPSQTQPLVIKTSPVRHTLSSHIHMATVDSPIESVLTERSRPLTPAVQDICLSAIVSSTAWSNRWSLSPNSVPLIVQQARHLSYVIALPSVCPSVGKALLLWRTSTLGLGTTWGVVPTGSQLAGTLSDFADHDGQFGLPLHHPRFLE